MEQVGAVRSDLEQGVCSVCVPTSDPREAYAALAQVRPSATIRNAKGYGSDFAMLARRASHAA